MKSNQLKQAAIPLVKKEKKPSPKITIEPSFIITPETNAGAVRKVNKKRQSQQIISNETPLFAGFNAGETAEKIISLYDFAPLGYFSLSPEGNVIELNLGAARMLGKERPQIKGNPFSDFVSQTAKPVFILFLHKIFSSTAREICVANACYYYRCCHNQPAAMLFNSDRCYRPQPDE
jgi:PAS domain-containing protein